jgi:chloramphenicol 3-O phosphotransferase
VTTLSKAIQHLSDKPWLLLGIDTFFHMMPSKYVGFGEKASEGYNFIPGQDEDEPLMSIKVGPFGRMVTQSIPKVAQSLVRDGHNLIIDEVLRTDEELENYERALASHTVYFIGVMCDLKDMQEREILRGDRALGLARGQITSVHGLSRPYDLTVNTTTKSAFYCAQEILCFIRNIPNPQSFK